MSRCDREACALRLSSWVCLRELKSGERKRSRLFAATARDVSCEIRAHVLLSDHEQHTVEQIVHVPFLRITEAIAVVMQTDPPEVEELKAFYVSQDHAGDNEQRNTGVPAS